MTKFSMDISSQSVKCKKVASSEGNEFKFKGRSEVEVRCQGSCRLNYKKGFGNGSKPAARKRLFHNKSEFIMTIRSMSDGKRVSVSIKSITEPQDVMDHT